MTDYRSDQDTFIKTDSIKQGYNLTECNQHGTKWPKFRFFTKVAGFVGSLPSSDIIYSD